MEDAMRREFTGQASPPPGAERDPRPLAEAIVGQWRAGPMSLSFAADGTVAVVLPSGQERRGRWRVDAAGRLHADVTGSEQAGDARVVGDALTVLLDGTAVTFRRG
jgi:hypothetical protein